MEFVNLTELKARLVGVLAAEAGDGAAAEVERIIDSARSVRPEQWQDLALEWAERRAQGVPLGLVIGRQPFLGVELLAKDDVLAPREETEILGREVLAILHAEAAEDRERELRMIDMGCGSGNLACAVATAIPHARVWASDITASCAALTRENVLHLGLRDRVQVSVGDLFAPLSGLGLEGTMDVVVMNPPYIPSTSLEKSHAGLLHHEPRAAFDGGPYGVSVVTRLLQEAPAFLKARGHLLFEFGLGQERIVQSLAQRKNLYAEIRFATDAGGNPRVAVLRT
jgi:release factor glutamine methyltransferase